jgi:hypothetical protein
MSVIAIERGVAPAPAPAATFPSGIAFSAILHLGLLILVVVGLPALFRPPPPVETPIAVELITIAPETRATRPNPYRPKPESRLEPAPAPPAPKPPEPRAEPTPPVAAPPAAAPPPPPPKPEPRPEAKAQPAPPPKPVEAQTPPQPPPPQAAPRPEPRPAAPPKTDPKKSDPAAFDRLVRNLEHQRPAPPAFDSLLQNLTTHPAAPAEETPPQRPPRMAATAPPSAQPQAPLAAQLSASEKDLIIRQIERCWNIPAGARSADNLIIEIKAVVNPDGTVQQATIVDGGRYASDPFFRAAADSAKRAVLNPRCSPLPVPPDKYEAWRNLDLFFNPKDLL